MKFKKLICQSSQEVCNGQLVLDVAMTIIGCCYPTNNKQDPELVKSLLEGYNSIRQLTPLELEYLNDFVDYCALAVAFWRFRQFNIRNPDPLLQDKYTEMEQRIKN